MTKFGTIKRGAPWAALSGALLALAYPLFDINFLAWLALAPLIWILIETASPKNSEPSSTGEKKKRFSERAARPAFALGFVAGLVFHLIGLYWLLAIPVTPLFKALLFLGYVLLSAYLALYFGAWTAALALFARVIGGGGASRRIALCALGAVTWVALEWVRGWMLGGFPWNFLGVSQHKMISVIQIASVTGVYGVSFVVCFVNLALAFTARRFWKRLHGAGDEERTAQSEERAGASAPGKEDSPIRPSARSPVPLAQWGAQISWEFTLAMVMMMALVMGSVRSMLQKPAAQTRALPVALVQGNVPQTMKWEEEFSLKILEDYSRLTRKAAPLHPRLIIWPETSTPKPLRVVEEMPGGVREIRYLPDMHETVTTAAKEAGAPLLVGSIDVTGTGETRGPGNYYNAAFLIEPDGSIGEPYRKMRLVPFGETVPFEKWLPFLKWLTPIQGSFAAGSEYTIFRLDEPAAFGVVICFEDVMPDHCRHFAAGGADFLVTITNDAWFGRTAGAYQHAANSVFRAVENQRPLLRCANTGMTCVVDARGKIVSVLEGGPGEKIFVQDVLHHTLQLPANPPTTFYTRRGDVFARACALLSALVVVVCAVGARRKREKV